MAVRKPTPLPVMIFKVVSTGCIIELIRLKDTENGQKITRPIYEFKYVNRPDNKANGGIDKPNFTTYFEDIQKALYWEVWERIPESVLPAKFETTMF